MNEPNNKQEMTELEVKKLEGEELLAVEQKLKEATENILEAKEKLHLAHLSLSLVLHPKQAFPMWPVDHSIPRVTPSKIKQLCGSCKLEFISCSFDFASCGCLFYDFHPTCSTAILQEGQLICSQCFEEFNCPMLVQ